MSRQFLTAQKSRTLEQHFSGSRHCLWLMPDVSLRATNVKLLNFYFESLSKRSEQPTSNEKARLISRH
jgi:hypothetical protein